MIYEASKKDTPLRQCEILSNVAVFVAIPGYAGEKWQSHGEVLFHPFAVVMSQDCDLEQDFFARRSDPPKPALFLPNILLCEAQQDSELFLQAKDQGSRFRELVLQNKSERYHFLSRVLTTEDACGKGFGAFAIDFKRYFTVPTGDLYAQISSNAERRTTLKANYLEHLSTRFCYFQYRVALEKDHHTVEAAAKAQEK